MTTAGNRPGDATSTMRDRAQNVAEKVVDKVQETASRVTGRDHDDGSPGQHAGNSAPIMDQAAEQVTSKLDMGKDYLVDSVTGVASALRQTGQHLRDEGSQPMLAKYAERGAEQIEHFGGYLRRRDSEALIADVERFARRKPLAFAGGAFALGMLAVRFLRSGGQTPQQTRALAPASGYGNPSSGYSTPPQRYGTPESGYVTPSPQYGTSTSGTSSAMPSSTQSTRPPASTGNPTTGTGGGMGTPPGTGAGRGAGTGSMTPGGTPTTESERARPATPSTNDTPTAPRTPPQSSGGGDQSGRNPSTTERQGAGNRTQP